MGRTNRSGTHGGAADPADAILQGIGGRVRSLRLERGMTLEQVAQSAGLTRAFLSQLERGGSSASVTSLYRIAAALGVEFTSLFELPTSALVRGGERVATNLGGRGTVDYLLTPESERRTQLIETHIEPGGTADDELWTRPGELVIAHVTLGVLELVFEDETVTLGRGDTLTFDPSRPHTWRNPSGRGRTVVLWVHTPATY